MAIGLGLMMGFRFRENFDHPYVSKSVTEFWRRWHISLSSWLRDYLYIPLGGNRRGRTRTYVNLMTVMLLGGLWHGAAWTFVLWGALHGGALAVERVFKERGWQTPPPPLALPSTLLLVIAGWVTFRASGLEGALGMYAGMVGLNGWGVSDTFAWLLEPSALTALVIAWGLVYLIPWWRGFVESRAHSPGLASFALTAPLAVLPLFVLGVLRLSADTFSPFLYFQF